MVLTETPICEFGLQAIDFNLPGIDGRNWSLEQCRGKNGTLVMFICNHCPYVKAVQELLVSNTKELMSLGVNSVAIMSNDTEDYPEDSFDNMKKVADQFNYPFPYLIDESQDVAKAYGAVCTPDFYGYNTDLELQYRGRLDASGMQPAKSGMKSDLFDAMRQIANSGNGPEQQIPSMGCSIKWRK